MKKAFTLIELLIVMTVIAILAGILIPSFRGYQSEAWHIKAEADINTLQGAIESYFRTHDNKYPDSLADLLSSSPRFIPQLPKDPYRTNLNGYGYEVITKKPGNEPFYVIYSNGPNRLKNWVWNSVKGVIVLEPTSDDIVFTNAIID